MGVNGAAAEEQRPDQQQQDPVEPEKLRVDVSEDQDDEGEEKAQAASPEERRDRRRQWREARQKERERYSALEENYKGLERRIAELTTRLAQPQPQQALQPREQADPASAEIEAISEQQGDLLALINGSPSATPEQLQRWSARWRALDNKRVDLLVGRRVAQSGRSQQQEDPRASEDRFVAQTLQAEFPEIYASQALSLKAQAEMVELMERHGKPRSLATAREACERVSPRRRAAPPTANEQARYTAVPSRAGTGGGSSNMVTPSLAQMRTARAYTSHLPDLSDEERFRRWWKEVGKNVSGT